MEKEKNDFVTLSAAKSGVIQLQKKYTKSTKRRECPPVFVIFHFIKAPSKSSGPHRIQLPHPVRPFPFQSAVVFVTGEASKWEKSFEPLGLNITAISLSMLKKKYTNRKSRDQLLHSCEVFFCEKSASSVLPNNLGTQFFSRNRQPIVVTLNPDDPTQMKEEFQAATESGELYIRHHESCSVRVGGFNLTFDNLAENIIDCCTQALNIIPKAKLRIDSVSLMTSGIELPPIWTKNAKRTVLKREDIIPKIVKEEIDTENEEEEEE
ncbi:ribosomal L1 domain-containing protein 1-like [Histomonas meleagridis]|uniref:ribosomal L1 domain-containing protein 1-like n=1 Tax=Histomonas meleagridis TaxID=135588 RepID=UPI00355A3953|nr:ribosomal L1 domain-containing protein 1-like [Histomonas meleagridis]KAH0804910.1 ribosomal L1 domain-containing protein 1-like [Histomonas meleagridis]